MTPHDADGADGIVGPWRLLGLDDHPLSRSRPTPDVVERALAALAGDARATGPGSPDLATSELLPALGAVAPAALERHARLGLPPAVSRATLADVGRKVRAYGDGVEAGWFLGLLRADVVAVGRLQVERRVGPHGRELHVPEGTPLLPGAVDEAVRAADALLGAAPCTCRSWLLDPWLRSVLPATGGIARFADAFRLVDDSGPADDGGEGEGGGRDSGGRDGGRRDGGRSPTAGDRSVARFVFRAPLEDLLAPEGAPPGATRTSLQRAVLAHLRTGGHVREPRGVHVRR